MGRQLNDVAIYAPFASSLLLNLPGRALGGAELQATLLGRSLAADGLRVAQIVYADDRLSPSSAGVQVLQRREPSVGRRAGPVREWHAIWGALHAASAATYVHRGAGPEAALTAAYCKTVGSRFVYSSSSTADFTEETVARSGRDRALLSFSLRVADVVVVQTEEQAELACARGVKAPIEVIPSFVECPGESDQSLEGTGGEYFLWAGGASTYKRPELLLELARSVPEAKFMMILAARDQSNAAIGLPEIRAQAEELPNLTFGDAVPRARLMSLIKDAVAVVNTSDVEGMPNVFLEAWARGVPALSLGVDPDGIIEANGLGVAAGGHTEHFIAGARALWRDRASASAAGERAREFVRERHDLRRVRDLWLGVVS